MAPNKPIQKTSMLRSSSLSFQLPNQSFYLHQMSTRICNKSELTLGEDRKSRNPGTTHHFSSYSFPRIPLANVMSLVNKVDELQISLDKSHISVTFLTKKGPAIEDFCSNPNYGYHFKSRFDENGVPLFHGGGVAFLLVYRPKSDSFITWNREQLRIRCSVALDQTQKPPEWSILFVVDLRRSWCCNYIM